MTLDPRIKEHLEYFGVDTNNTAAIESLALTEGIRDFLFHNGDGFTDKSLDIIENYKPLVAGLNKFWDDKNAGKKKIDFDGEDGQSFYNPEKDTLSLSLDLFPKPKEIGRASCRERV